jgi:hypothetical protein
MPLIRHPKKRGEWVELQFMARAASHGFTVCKPMGDSARFDVIVCWKRKLNRVQVKSTIARNCYGSYVCATHARPNLGPYTAKDMDFFVVYVIEHDAWYIIPAKAIAGRKRNISVNPHRNALRKPYEHFREAWHLLKG